MARKRELTISEEMELNWDDGRHSPSDEKHLMKEFELGWCERIQQYADAGQTQLRFDPMRLVV